MEELFKKFLDNQCSPEDVRRLLSYFSQPENEELLRRLITEHISDREASNSDEQEAYPSDNILSEMKKQLGAGKINLLSFLDKIKLQSASVAILLFGDSVISMI